jgi:hypothetical protein
MKNPFGDAPDLDRLRGVVAAEILAAAAVASQKLREAGIPHAIAGGLAVGAYGYPRTTDDVHFLVGDEAFEKHPGGLVTLKLPLIAIGNVRIDFVSIDESRGEKEQLRPAVDAPPESGRLPVVPLTVLVYMKLKAGRQIHCGPRGIAQARQHRRDRHGCLLGTSRPGPCSEVGTNEASRSERRVTKKTRRCRGRNLRFRETE